jgi:cellulose synthase (UDP-forming)
MRITKIKKIPNTALLFVLLAPFTIVFYAIYVFNPVHIGNPYLYPLQLFADTIAIIVVGSLWLTILLDLLQPEYHKQEITYRNEWLDSSHPKVDILIPTANEPYEIVANTIYKANAIIYPYKKIYILDDGSSEKLKELAASINATYIRRTEKNAAKAGNLNNGLQYCMGEFFAVFDADHAPKPDFLTSLLPFFENKNIALVQTPQHFINTENFIASGTSQAQELFYKYIQPAKNSYNASFCVGTNMIYRRSAITEIGGITAKSHSEDIWTTILLHEKGYESVFYNRVLAEGRAPETIRSFFRQQNRWAQGGFSLFFTHNPLFVKGLSLDQRLQYFFSNIHYFSGFAILIYLVLPILYLLFGIIPLDVQESHVWLMHYIPFFITIYFLPFFLLGNLKLSTISTSLASFAPYLKAFFATITNHNYNWIATESKSNKFSFIAQDIWPHVFIIALSFFAIPVGWYDERDFATTLATTVWVLLNAGFLILFIKNGGETQKVYEKVS